MKKGQRIFTKIATVNKDVLAELQDKEVWGSSDISRLMDRDRTTLAYLVKTGQFPKPDIKAKIHFWYKATIINYLYEHKIIE